MEILSPGKKIKLLRKKIGLRQDQLTDDKITRSLISMIENGKRRLNRKTATIIAYKLNQFYKNLGKEVTPEYLLESEEEQARKIINYYLEGLMPIIENKNESDYQHVHEIFNKMLALSKEWKLRDKESEVLLTRGTYYFDCNKYNLAMVDYFNALEYYLEVRESSPIALLYIKVADCYIKMSLLEQALFYSDKAFNLSDEVKLINGNDIKAQALYNKMRCYISEKRYDLALQEIDKYKDVKGVSDKKLDEILLMEANTYLALRNFEKAKKIYDKLINRESGLTVENLARMYCETAHLYNLLGSHDEALEQVKKAVALKNKISNSDLPQYFLDVSKGYQAINEIETAKYYLEEAIEAAKLEKDDTTLITALMTIAAIYKGQDKLELAEIKLLQAESQLEIKKSKLKLREIFTLLGELYCEMGSLEKSKLYFKKIRNI